MLVHVIFGNNATINVVRKCTRKGVHTGTKGKEALRKQEIQRKKDADQ
jgi:hypothetical protein